MLPAVLCQGISDVFKPGAVRAPFRMQDKCTFAQMTGIAVVRIGFCRRRRGQTPRETGAIKDLAYTQVKVVPGWADGQCANGGLIQVSEEGRDMR